MSAKPIREFDGKRLLAEFFQNNYKAQEALPSHFVQITANDTEKAVLAAHPWLLEEKLVVKPDQLIKRRGKSGLIQLNVTWNQAWEWIQSRIGKDVVVEGLMAPLTHFVVEPFLPHSQDQEMYVCIQSVRAGEEVLFYHQGGVDIGDVDSKAQRVVVPVEEDITSSQILQLTSEIGNQVIQSSLQRFITHLITFCRALHFTYLEINPLVVKMEGSTCKVFPLDMASKVDQTADFLCHEKWGRLQFPPPFGRHASPEEKYIQDLDAKTGASLKLTVLNEKGRIWTMVAGGGASVVYADTICDLGHGRELANYGEYSGDPSEALTYQYAKTILKLMTTGNPHPEGKILIVGGGIANFTNVAQTFTGIVRAITEFAERLQNHRVRIFVRRGGPNYQEGLQIMRECGDNCNVDIDVYGPETHVTSIVSYALGVKEPNRENISKSESFSDLLKQPGTNSSSSSSSNSRSSRGPNKRVKVDKNNKTNQFQPLFDNQTFAFVYGMQPRAVQNMLDFDHVCQREKVSVVAMIYPFRGNHFQKFYHGNKEILIPVYQKIEEAIKRHPEVSTMVNFASFRSVFESTVETFEYPQIKTVAIIAEGVPEQQTKAIIKRAAVAGVTLIGPATVGGIKPGCFRIGNTGGMIDNIVASKLYRPGSVAYVSKSGGMSNELNNIVSRNSNGVYEGVAIGGDRFPGTTFMDHIIRYQRDPNVKIIILLGEVGGTDEYALCDAIKSGEVNKPVVAWCMGTCAKVFPYEVQFGHAGALAQGKLETAEAKNAAMKAAGAHVPSSFEEFGTTLKSLYEKLKSSGVIEELPEPSIPALPMDYSWAQKLGLIRKPTNFVSTISDERGDELTYSGVPISTVFEDDLGVGGVISLLWFRRRLPAWATKFLEMVLIICADHGPAVSGAHNTIITARAGKDLISALVSGLMTIGPRFGGAIDGAAQQFSRAVDEKTSPRNFVDNMKKQNKLIMGIGHRVKSIDNLDARVRILKDYVLNEFPNTDVVKYALDVEQITTKKKATLILNVDGLIGASMVDLLRGSGAFSREEADSYIQSGALNGLFVLARSIGFIGHYLDQSRLKQPLYRHPWDDISYTDIDI